MILKIIRKKVSSKNDYKVYNNYGELVYETTVKKGIISLINKNRSEVVSIESKFSFFGNYTVKDNKGNILNLKGGINFKRLIKILKVDSKCIKLDKKFSRVLLSKYEVLDFVTGDIIAKIDLEGNLKATTYTIEIKNKDYTEILLGMIIGLDKIKRASRS